MNKPNVYKVTGYIRATYEVVAVNPDAAALEFEAGNFDKIMEIEATEVEDLGEYYAD